MSSWLSFKGMRILPQGEVIALEKRPVIFPRCRVADFLEVEEPLVEFRPEVHPAAMNIVGQMVEIGQPAVMLGDLLFPPSSNTKSTS